MFASLRLLQTLVHRIVPQAVKPFGPVKVKILGADSVLQAKERFDPVQLRNGIGDQPVTVDDEQLFPGEHVQPPVNVVVVSGHGYRPVIGVDRAVRPDDQLFERPAAPVGHRVAVQLSVIRYGPDHGIPEYQQQLHARVHRLDPFRDLLRNKKIKKLNKINDKNCTDSPLKQAQDKFGIFLIHTLILRVNLLR